jgi:translation initiation factor IF-2
VRLPLRTAVNCPSFTFIRDFHIGETNFKRRKTKEEKAAPRIIEYSPKKKFTQSSDIVDIWRNMTVKDLADSAGRDLEHVQEAMLYVKDAPDIHPKTKLEDLNIIKDIVKKCGMRMKIVGAPTNQKPEQEKDRDVEKRPPADPKDLKPRAPVVTVMG